jgi:hypothetical protein
VAPAAGSTDQGLDTFSDAASTLAVAPQPEQRIVASFVKTRLPLSVTESVPAAGPVETSTLPAASCQPLASAAASCARVREVETLAVWPLNVTEYEPVAGGVTTAR